MGKLLNKGEKLRENFCRNPHGLMLLMKDDTMLRIIYIGRILEEKLLPCQVQWNNSMIFPCRKVQSTPVAFTFLTKHTGRIGRGLHLSKEGNHLRILLRFT